MDKYWDTLQNAAMGLGLTSGIFESAVLDRDEYNARQALELMAETLAKAVGALQEMKGPTRTH